MYDLEKVDDFIFRAENIAKSCSKAEAFLTISAEIDACEDIHLNDFIAALNFIRYDKTLDWIEGNTHRIANIGINWGHVAASSHFSWDRTCKWLSYGRPLSLIALDALMFCTTHGDRLNQSLWMRRIRPRLADNPRPEIIAKRIQEYLQTDSVPRTKAVVREIIGNIFEAGP